MLYVDIHYNPPKGMSQYVSPRRVDYVCHNQRNAIIIGMTSHESLPSTEPSATARRTPPSPDRTSMLEEATTRFVAKAEAARSLHDRLLDEWGTAIVNGDITPGERLPDPVAADGTGTAPSRTVTREATRVLESMGLVTVRRKSGATVNPIDRWNMFDPQVIRWRLMGEHRIDALRELAQMRAAVEPAAARLAASHATPGQWAALTEAAIGMVSHSNHADEQDYLDADALFHRTLMQASGNLMLANMGDMIVSSLEGRTQHELMPKTANQKALDLHAEVAALIRKGDGEGAESAMHGIVDEAADAVERMRR